VVAVAVVTEEAAVELEDIENLPVQLQEVIQFPQEVPLLR
tara:strand:+ start:54 stop:173 length:120 start_codon:yes stop_codon:yes gene_type:complete